ncbi:hypothetical protein CTAYLR_006016, partial [Chrysophaeum taylorii]
MEWLALDNAPLRLSKLKRVVHLKGFASNLDFEDAETAAAARSVLRWLRAAAVDAIVWDGDDLDSSSFTHVVDAAYRGLGVALVAFKYSGDKATFEKSWDGRRVLCVLVDDPPVLQTGDRHVRLGVSALYATRA